MGCWCGLGSVGAIRAWYCRQVADRHENTQICILVLKTNLKLAKHYMCPRAPLGGASCPVLWAGSAKREASSPFAKIKTK